VRFLLSDVKDRGEIDLKLHMSTDYYIIKRNISTKQMVYLFYIVTIRNQIILIFKIRGMDKTNSNE
jgi:hypothetical protein